MKNRPWLIIGCLLLAAGWTASGQVTNVQTEMNSLRLEWTAMPGNPYRVYATPDLVEPVWSNQTPAGLSFADDRGIYEATTGITRLFFCTMASDYLIIDLVEGPEATNYPVSYTNVPPVDGWEDEYKTTKMVLRRIPGGTFMMGSPSSELGRSTNEQPHVVKLTKDYYIGVFETTQKQWERVMSTWPSYFSNATCRESRPVEQVSYNDIRGTVAGTNWPADGNVDTNSFLGRLRTKTGKTFDLPTEAQWERACRSGTTNALNSGYDLTSEPANVRMDAVGRYMYNGGGGYTSTGDISVATAKVGSYMPSTWGLYDMHGNVLEWCLDWYENMPSSLLDPLGPISGSFRVIRSGGWVLGADCCRSAFRDRMPSTYGDYSFGFRVSLNLGQ